MLREKLSRLVSEFTSQVFAALKRASLEELTELAQSSRDAARESYANRHVAPRVTQEAPLTMRPHPTKRAGVGAAKQGAQWAAGKAMPAATANRSAKKMAFAADSTEAVAVEAPVEPQSEPQPLEPADPQQVQAALEHFAERGGRGSTAHHLEAHLASLGFAPARGLVEELVSRGEIRDAGFRRAIAAGKTGAVFVRTSQS
ncbi:MAG: hypothetical protein FWD73_10020 [Polyangiaceae bacterium]|nr:hypothetical protein [Polyangiaceae bacterium]